MVPTVRRLAIERRVVDTPDARRAHDLPTPRLGGVAIFLSLVGILALGSLVLGAGALGQAARWNPWGVLGFAGGALVVFVAGAVDDIRGLRPSVKLLAALLGAAIATGLGGCRIEAIRLPSGATLDLGALAVPATLLWVAAITHAVNLVDGMDGLAAGVSAIAFGAVALIARPEHASVPLLAAILCGACLGFLPFNLPRASIFLGDAGSLLLGFSLGVLSTYGGADADSRALGLETPLVVAVPLGDMIFAVLRRTLAGGPGRVFTADRGHVHHRLVDGGLSPRAATASLCAIHAAACAAAVSLARAS